MMMDDFRQLVGNIKAGDTATANVEKWDPSTAEGGQGVGTVAAPRGMLGHWIKIKDGRIENYQCVVPTTWNGSPRDHKGPDRRLRGQPAEHADGQPGAAGRDPAHAAFLSIPCLACSTHARDEPDGQKWPPSRCAEAQRRPVPEEIEMTMKTRRRRPCAPWAFAALAATGAAQAHTGHGTDSLFAGLAHRSFDHLLAMVAVG